MHFPCKAWLEKPAIWTVLYFWRLLRHFPASGSGINVVGFFHGCLGLGQAARILADQWEAQGHKVYRINMPLALEGRIDPSLCAQTVPDGNGAITVVVGNPDILPYMVRLSLHRRFLRAPVVAGYWFWEQTHVPLSYKRRSAFVDEIWVASRFLEQVFSREIPAKPVRVVPFCWRTLQKRMPEISPVSPSPPRNSIRVFTIYDQASSFWRKRPDFALRIFQSARDLLHAEGLKLDLVLHINPYLDPGISATEKRFLSEVRKDPRIEISQGPLPAAVFFQKMASAHIFLSTSCAEGLGLPFMEARILGLDVLITGWSGIAAEYPHDFIALPYHLKKPHLAEADRLYDQKGLWAYVDIPAAVRMLCELARKNYRELSADDADFLVNNLR